MKYVFVGDIHGQWERVEEALAKDGKKIFVGDFMDSFDRTKNDMGRCLELVIEAIKRGDAQCIFGNHELSYLYAIRHRCSGYSAKRRHIIMQRQIEIFDLFKPYIFINPNFLVSHAGLTKEIWEGHGMNLMTHEERVKLLDLWWDDLGSPMHWIGRARGGSDPVGGMFWCDFNWEFQGIEGLTQVFGHTRGNGIRTRDGSYCIDCLEDDKNPSFLELDL